MKTEIDKLRKLRDAINEVIKAAEIIESETDKTSDRVTITDNVEKAMGRFMLALMEIKGM